MNLTPQDRLMIAATVAAGMANSKDSAKEIAVHSLAITDQLIWEWERTAHEAPACVVEPRRRVPEHPNEHSY